MRSPPAFVGDDVDGKNEEALEGVPDLPLEGPALPAGLVIPPHIAEILKDRDIRTTETMEDAEERIKLIEDGVKREPKWETYWKKEAKLIPKLEMLRKWYKENNIIRQAKMEKTQPGASAFFKGVKTAGKGTRRRKHRKHKKWTSSATRKRSSMSASKARRARK